MKPSTLWEIDTFTPEGSRYGAEGENLLFGDFTAVRRKMIEDDQDGVTIFDDPQNSIFPRHWDDYARMAETAASYSRIQIPKELDREFRIAANDWPTAGTDSFGHLLVTGFPRLNHGALSASHSPHRSIISTATNVLAADTYDQLVFHVPRNRGKASTVRQLLDVALRRPVTVVLVSDQSPDLVPSETLSALRSMKNLPDNWDGDGASPIDEATVTRAEQLIRQAFLASPKRLKPPSIAPGYGGMIVAEWSGPAGTELILDIPAENEPPGFLLIEISPAGDELETDAYLGDAWSIQDLIARLISD